MNFEAMSLEQLKEYAKEQGIKVGNIGKEKLIERIKESENVTELISNEDDDLAFENVELETTDEEGSVGKTSILESIESAIDELDSNEDSTIEPYVELPRDTVINVRSITFGTLIYKSPTNNAKFVWNNIGSVIQMTIGEITEMNNQKPDFLTNPNVILLNEDAIRQFRLTKVYENVAQINNLKSLFKKSEREISEVIDKALVANMRDILISKIRTMYQNKALTDINVIQLLERKLQFDLVSK